MVCKYQYLFLQEYFPIFKMSSLIEGNAGMASLQSGSSMEDLILDTLDSCIYGIKVFTKKKSYFEGVKRKEKRV